MYNSLLLTGDGTNNATNNTFVDSSTNNFAITRYGNATQGTFSPYGTNWSNYFDGAGDSLQAPSGSSISGTGDFTAECWIYPTAVPGTYNVIGCSDTTGGLTMFGLNANGTIFMGRSLIDVQATTTNSLSYNTWNHIAVSRSSGTVRLFINGVQGYSGSITTNYNAGVVRLGTDGGGSALPYTGYVSNFRIVPGTALYTTAFTPSTTPLTAVAGTSLLTCQSNRFKDNSTNNFAITRNGDTKILSFAPFEPSSAYSASTTGGSVYLDGTGDYLLAASASVTLPGNFTVECWIYPTSFTAVPSSAYINYGSYASGGFAFNTVYGANNGSLWFYAIGVGTPVITSTINTVLNSWNHIAVVRSGSTCTMYINGQSAGTASGITATFTTGSTGIFVGNDVSSEYTFGYISDARIATSAVYTGAFTPPTAPLTAISGTQFLASMSNGGIVDSAMQNNLETVGDAKISTTQSKFGGSSMSFDGTGDYLKAPTDSRTNFNFRTGDFTVEAWVYPTAAGQYDVIMGTNSGTYTNGWQIIYDYPTPSTWNFVFQAGTNYGFSFGALSLNTWSHIAATRNGTTVRTFVNGIQITSSTTGGGSDVNETTGTLYVGYTPELLSGREFNGYIDDLRITKGLARYTANFTPPTAALPTY